MLSNPNHPQGRNGAPCLADQASTSSNGFPAPSDLYRPPGTFNRRISAKANPVRPTSSTTPMARDGINKAQKATTPESKSSATCHVPRGRDSSMMSSTGYEPSPLRHELAAPEEILKGVETSHQTSTKTVRKKAGNADILAPTALEDWEVLIEEVTSESDLESEIWSDAEETADTSDATLLMSPRTPQQVVNHYSSLPIADMKESFEEAMLITLGAKVFDAVLAEVKGDDVLDNGACNIEFIRQLREGIDENNRKVGLPSLGEVYGKLSPNDKVRAAIPAEPPKILPAAPISEAKQSGTGQRGVTNRPTRNLARTEILLKNSAITRKTANKSYQKVKSRYLQEPRRPQALKSKGKSEQSELRAWWEKSQ